MPISGTFENGFIEGWKLIAGARAAAPAITPQPITGTCNKSPYEIGMRLGMEAAKKRKGIQ
jgi:hypothetical protein